MAEIPAEEFIAQDVPADAAIACGGFWSGATANRYVLRRGITISEELNQDEETADNQAFTL